MSRRTIQLVAVRRCADTARRLRLVSLLLLACLSAGCASQSWVSVRPVPKNPLSSQLKLLAYSGPRPSERTMQLLRRYNLANDLKHDPQELLVKLRTLYNREPTDNKLYTIAELAYLGGKKTEPVHPQRALELYGAAVLNSYLYLFDDQFAHLRNPYDPEFRGACDLYNGALESALRIIKRQHGLRPGHTELIQVANHSIEFTIALRGKHWQPDDFDRFEFVSDYAVKGLKNQYHTYGLGVPLIAVRKNRSDEDAVERYYPPGLSFPVTAFLRVLTDKPGAGPQHVGVLELYDPLTDSDIKIAGRRTPLESDLSTPLAYFLNQPQLRNLDQSTAGLLNPEATEKARGLYMLEPYQPGKIPVLMVHGIWSSPITWMEMFNDLRSAPEIRDRYQFWFYLYPTGQPFWYSAAEMRKDLAETRRVVDPQKREAALDQMVLVGHSMGGLVSQLQTVESNDDYWRVVSKEPFQLIKASPDVKETLSNTFFFHSNPSVRRLITIGTPFQGSRFANGTTRWIGSKLITLPQMLVRGGEQLRRDNPGFFGSQNLIDVPTSIDSLSPSSPIFPVLLASPKLPWVKHHNIVGEIPHEGFIGHVVGGSDGVVSYSSAHRDDVDSEIVVNADHSQIHRHPLSVLEVRRILLEHLQDLDAFPRSIQRLPRVESFDREARRNVP